MVVKQNHSVNTSNTMKSKTSKSNVVVAETTTPVTKPLTAHLNFGPGNIAFLSVISGMYSEEILRVLIDPEHCPAVLSFMIRLYGRDRDFENVTRSVYINEESPIIEIDNCSWIELTCKGRNGLKRLVTDLAMDADKSTEHVLTCIADWLWA